MESNWRDHISATPEVMGGVPVIKSTRIPVSVVLDNLAAGLSEAELLSSYPTLSLEDIRAVLGFAAELAKDQILELK